MAHFQSFWGFWPPGDFGVGPLACTILDLTRYSISRSFSNARVNKKARFNKYTDFTYLFTLWKQYQASFTPEDLERVIIQRGEQLERRLPLSP